MEESDGHDLNVDVDGVDEDSINVVSGLGYGGLMLTQEAVPMCKHLLACFLSEQCEALSGFVEERIVGRDEAAGWAAGWGD